MSQHSLLASLGGALSVPLADFGLEAVLASIVPDHADGCVLVLSGDAPAAERVSARFPSRPDEDWTLAAAALEDAHRASGVSRPLHLDGKGGRAGATKAGPTAEPTGADGAPSPVAPVLEAFGAHSGVIVPLSIDGRVLGSLALFAGEERDSLPQDVEELEEAGRRIAIAVENGRLLNACSGTGEMRELEARRRTERELLERNREQAAVARLARCALSRSQLEEVMDEAVRLLSETLGVEFAKVLELLPGGEEFLLKVAVGFPRKLVDVQKVPAHRGSQAGFTLDHSGPVLVEDFRLERRFAIPAILSENGIRSGMSVVVEGADRPFGVLGIHSKEPRTYTPSELSFMQTVADVLGQAVERRATEEAVLAREREFKTLAEHAPDIVARFDSKLRYLYVNSEVERVSGMKPRDMVGKTIRELGAPTGYADRFEEALRDVLEHGGKHTLEFEFSDAERGRRVYECRLVAEPGGADRQGRTVLCLIRNVTEAREAGERIRYQASLLDAVGEGVAGMELDGRVVSWNRHCEHLSGWKAEEVIGRNVVDVVATRETREETAALFAHVASGSSWAGELALARKGGGTCPVFVTAAPIRDQRGEIVGIVGASTDLTDRKRLEEELRQAQKMEAVGRLAGGVAHDFNNLLTSIRGHADLLGVDLAPEDPRRSHALEIIASAERAAGLTRQLLAFSRKQVLRPRVIELCQVVRAMDGLLRRIIGEDVDFRITCGTERCFVEADPTQVEQVVLNLVVNARDAMPLGGTLGVTVGHAKWPDSLTGGSGARRSGRCSVISISDTGTGIPSEARPYIFEPFFTTKEQGKGTGLGLSTVYGIVQQSEGEVLVDSQPDVGTTISVYLPALEGVDVTDAEPPLLQTAAAIGETILIVEDEASVRLLLRRFLMRLGYHVLEASQGEEALRIWNEEGERVDLVLTDVIMPIMSGNELVKQLRERSSAVPVLFTSGYTDDRLAQHNVLGPDVNLLEKPFTLESLARKVRSVLGNGVPTGRAPK